ncbi:MAG TPA: hypothetical protein DDZ67_14565 [Xanthomonadaceae bacterium]|nr:hypothetical protein [Xanthomonadaceae bacterium]
MIGDTLGREVGEEVLLQLCRELQARVDGHGWIAFQPAEDFVVAIDDRHDADALIEMLATLLSGPVRGRDSMHQLDVHIGVARFRADAADAEDVIGKAAQAAHAARERGVLVTRFDNAIAARLSERLRMVGRLHEAIDRGEFELHYQPIQHARDRRPVALEALLRWRRPDGGMVQPDEFIQLCEDTGLIVPLGRWVIGQAARDQRRLADAGWPDLAIAINVSALQFLNTDLAADVGAAINEHGLGRGALHVELTESSLMRDPELALRTMHELHAQGVCISLDDFGTGFSSMSYLQNMPLDSLKIDRSFVTDVDTNARNASICRALLTLGHNLGLKVIAEGVETQAQYDWLSDNGCDQVQGFLLGRPGPFEQVVGQLRRGADH